MLNVSELEKISIYAITGEMIHEMTFADGTFSDPVTWNGEIGDTGEMIGAGIYIVWIHGKIDAETEIPAKNRKVKIAVLK